MVEKIFFLLLYMTKQKQCAYWFLVIIDRVIIDRIIIDRIIIDRIIINRIIIDKYVFIKPYMEVL